jgi:hypothetical protein
MIPSTRSVNRWFVCCLIATLAQPDAAFSGSPESANPEPAGEQTPAPEVSVAVQAQGPARPFRFKSLRILPLEGDGAVNHLPTESVVVPAIAVHNDDEMPVEGVTVVFQLPASGPGGFFPDNQLSLVTVTNSRGQAIARGFRANAQPGRFPIRVTASFQDLTTSYVITQTNSRKEGSEMMSRGSRKWLWIAVAGGAVGAAGAVIGLRANSSPRISASVIGPIAIGAP